MIINFIQGALVTKEVFKTALKKIWHLWYVSPNSGVGTHLKKRWFTLVSNEYRLRHYAQEPAVNWALTVLCDAIYSDHYFSFSLGTVGSKATRELLPDERTSVQ